MSEVPPESTPVPTSRRNVTGILDRLVANGYSASFHPGPTLGSLRCSACRNVSVVGRFGDVWATRLEGASDPDDMVLVMAATCPICSQGGTVVLGFGPTASAEDSSIVAGIPDDAMHRDEPSQPAG